MPLTHPQDPGGAATPPIPARSVCPSAPSPQPRPRVLGGPTLYRHRRRAANSTHPPSSLGDDARRLSVPGKGPEKAEKKSSEMDRRRAPGSLFEQARPMCRRQGSRGGVAARVGTAGQKNDCGPQRLSSLRLRFEKGDGT